MDIFSSLLSGPALTILAVVVTLGLVIHAFTALAKDIPDLRIPAWKETIKEMQETITPQEKQARKLQDYHNTLLEIERKHALALQDKEASSEIQIHRR